MLRNFFTRSENSTTNTSSNNPSTDQQKKRFFARAESDSNNALTKEEDELLLHCSHERASEKEILDSCLDMRCKMQAKHESRMGDQTKNIQLYDAIIGKLPELLDSLVKKGVLIEAPDLYFVSARTRCKSS